jgi:cytochrome-b5 reductase
VTGNLSCVVGALQLLTCWLARRRLKVHYTLSTPPDGWKYSTGFLNLEMCQDNLFEYRPGTVTLLCGPPPMIQYACHPNLEKMGFEKGLTSIEF